MKLIYTMLFCFFLNAFERFDSNSAQERPSLWLAHGAVMVRQASNTKSKPLFNKLLLTGLSMTGDLAKLGVDHAIVQSALRAKADPNLRINLAYGATSRPMHYAAINGKITVAKSLLEHKADPMPVDGGDNTPLHISIANRRNRFTEFMITHLAKFKKGQQENPELEMLDKYDKWTPLHMACWFNDTDACRLLLQAGARPDAKLNLCGLLSLHDQDGSVSCHRLYRKSPLHIAASKGNVALIKMLVDEGANKDLISYTEGTPLHMAVKNCDQTAVQLLLVNGAAVDLPNADGLTPLECAHDSAIKELLEKHQTQSEKK